MDRKTGYQHGPKLPPTVVDNSARNRAGIHVKGRTISRVIPRQHLRQQGRLIVTICPVPMALYFLQGNDVCVGQSIGNARNIVTAVTAEPVLDVIADELQRIPPMKSSLLPCVRPVMLSKAPDGSV